MILGSRFYSTTNQYGQLHVTNLRRRNLSVTITATNVYMVSLNYFPDMELGVVILSNALEGLFDYSSFLRIRG